MKKFWLVKQEPSAYSWSDFVADKTTSWTGVRNFTARNNLRAMQKGDEVLFYHSVTEKAVVGVAEVARTAYPDPTAKEGDWSAVELKAEQTTRAGRSRSRKSKRNRAPERDGAAAPLAFIRATGHRRRVQGDRSPRLDLSRRALRSCLSRAGTAKTSL